MAQNGPTPVQRIPEPPPKSCGEPTSEPATQWTFDVAAGKWIGEIIWVTVAPKPFCEGSMRWCFNLQNHSAPASMEFQVGKLYKSPEETRESYFTEVEMTMHCAALAKEFNTLEPPKEIRFLEPKVIEFHNRLTSDGQRLIMSMEPQLSGDYKKHSNNYGYVSPEDRNTPAAFSHWTYHHTNKKMLVCDMQGVDDTYTDPQIHTPELRFGIADMGSDGIHQFFASHKCNAICQHLGLTDRPTSKNYSGTVPSRNWRSYSQGSSNSSDSDRPPAPLPDPNAMDYQNPMMGGKQSPFQMGGGMSWY
eukprot:NODE_218_length_1877_cov_68.988000_g193_i0.p1 GENE.NODE_218_length_1877_cov_68.988000_g193_i0~~NODE_218_length_1877_cov_68.988000_g193_i0.p1  ORF type:complete len:304 (-),score=60.20 NODE_218_length_1877_cov_68.988000_g193_i0:875-1786(-)